MESALPHQPDPMSRLVELARQLKAVKIAQRQFLAMWALSGSRKPGSEAVDDALADPGNRNWGLMYRGNILDD
jgi:hypothetical protein